jgi:hypothetical protein
MTPYRTQAAKRNLREGIKKMEKVMDASPLKRALRKFNAGRPTNQPVDTPLGAVVIAVEQRDRLARLLKDEGVEAQISTQIITRHKTPGIGVDYSEDTAVNEGSVHTAVRELEFYAQRGDQFTVSGLTFAIETAEAADVFTYTLERTPEGCAALLTKANEVRVRFRQATSGI